MLRPASSLLFLAVSAGLMMAQLPSAEKVQRVLDTIAAPYGPELSIRGLPDTYAAWSDQQRTSAGRQMTMRCATVWAMMGDSGRPKLLPPSQDPADTQRLVMGLCLAAHMPKDWPSRNGILHQAQLILDRSTALGDPLHLPAALQAAPPKPN